LRGVGVRKGEKISLIPSLRRRETDRVKALIYGFGQIGGGVDINGLDTDGARAAGWEKIMNEGGHRG